MFLYELHNLRGTKLHKVKDRTVPQGVVLSISSKLLGCLPIVHFSQEDLGFLIMCAA